ncbi:MAG: DUF1015 domain-containing protein [Clostridia bacterium]|nr:DUF1015 domain-containing protein [Clostridia bacterium]
MQSYLDFEAFGFAPADILLPPNADLRKWSVIAVDQYTSEKEYWDSLYEYVGNSPSILNMVLPEYYLEHESASENALREKNAAEAIRTFVSNGMLDVLADSFVYVEREQSSGGIRQGIVGMFDLEKYDYTPGSKSLIRATEETVESRLPPRMRIREDAEVEFPHILILCDDAENAIFNAAKMAKGNMVYDFSLYGSDQRISGKQIERKDADGIYKELKELYKNAPDGFLFAMGDGNHSLATAKAVYEKKKKEGASEEELSLARYALAELINIQDESVPFEPIHRLVMADFDEIEEKAKSLDGNAAYVYDVLDGGKEKTLTILSEPGLLPVAVMQKFLDQMGWRVDYIHNASALKKLAAEQHTTGILLPKPDRSLIFNSVSVLGVLPRKTFSLGHAEDKRYYLEGRKIK